MRWRSTAGSWAAMSDRVKVAFTVPTETPVLYPIAPIAASGNSAAAQKFVAYVVSPAGRATFIASAPLSAVACQVRPPSFVSRSPP